MFLEELIIALRLPLHAHFTVKPMSRYATFLGEPIIAVRLHLHARFTATLK